MGETRQGMPYGAVRVNDELGTKRKQSFMNRGRSRFSLDRSRFLNRRRFLKFERQHGWTIRTMKKESSQIRNEYAPVIFSQETVSYTGSLDMLLEQEDCENMLRARATSKAVLTEPFRLSKAVLTEPFRLQNDRLRVVLMFSQFKITTLDQIKVTAGTPSLPVEIGENQCWIIVLHMLHTLDHAGGITFKHSRANFCWR